MLGRARIAPGEIPARCQQRIGFALAGRQLGIEQSLAHAIDRNFDGRGWLWASSRSSTSAPKGIVSVRLFETSRTSFSDTAERPDTRPDSDIACCLDSR